MYARGEVHLDVIYFFPGGANITTTRSTMVKITKRPTTAMRVSLKTSRGIAMCVSGVWRTDDEEKCPLDHPYVLPTADEQAYNTCYAQRETLTLQETLTPIALVSSAAHEAITCVKLSGMTSLEKKNKKTRHAADR